MGNHPTPRPTIPRRRGRRERSEAPPPKTLGELVWTAAKGAITYTTFRIIDAIADAIR